MPTDYPYPLTDEHLRTLLEKGIDLEIAAHEGVRSVVAFDDLPEPFRGYAWVKDEITGEKTFRTGLLYEWDPLILRNGGAKIPQIKFDEPVPVTDPATGKPVLGRDGQPKTKKYLFPKGQHPGIWITSEMRERHDWGEARNLLIVEGTKQYLAVASALSGEAEELLDWVAVGVAGCFNWAESGIPAQDLSVAARGVQNVYVIFDGDVLSNVNVFNAGERLAAHMSSITGTEPLFMQVPTGGGVDENGSKLNGVDDWLGESFATRALRASALKNLLTNKQRTKRLPAKFPGRTNAVAVASGMRTPVIDVEAEQVREPDRVASNGAVLPGDPIAGFAPRIVRSFTAHDLHNQASKTTVLDIEIRANGRRYEVFGVSRAALDSRSGFAEILDRAGLSNPLWLNNARTHEQIILAMRAENQRSGAPELQGLAHTGWWQHPDLGPVFSVADGAVTGGAEAFTRDARTLFSEHDARSRYRFGVIESVSDGDIHVAASEAARLLDCFGEGTAKTSLYLCVSQIALAGSGARSQGMPYLDGPPGSGKSLLQGTAQAFYGSGIDAEVMTNKSSAVATRLGVGLSHIAVALDDVKRYEREDKYREVVSQLQDAIRRCYDGGKAGASRMVFDQATQNWVVGVADRTDPLFIGTGELLPPELDPSDIERLLVWEHRREHIINGPEMKKIRDSGHLVLANAGYLRWVAQSMAALGGVAEWDRHVREQRAALEAELLRQFADDPDRATRFAEVTAGRVLGWLLWCAFLNDIGVWTDDEAEAWSSAGEAAIVNAEKQHIKRHLSGTADAHTLIHDIQGLLMDPGYFLRAEGGQVQHQDDRRTCIGTFHVSGGKEYVCVHHVPLEKGLRLKRTEISALLRKVAEPSPTNPSRFQRSVRWRDINRAGRDVPMDLYWIPREIWDAALTDETKPDHHNSTPPTLHAVPESKEVA